MLSVAKNNVLRYNQKMKSREFLDKKIFCEDSMIGEVKEVIIDPVQWKVTHLEVRLNKDTAELVLGTRKGGIHNFLAVSAIQDVENKINLKVKKRQLHIYLKAPSLIVRG